MEIDALHLSNYQGHVTADKLKRIDNLRLTDYGHDINLPDWQETYNLCIKGYTHSINAPRLRKIYQLRFDNKSKLQLTSGQNFLKSLNKNPYSPSGITSRQAVEGIYKIEGNLYFFYDSYGSLMIPEGKGIYNLVNGGNLTKYMIHNSDKYITFIKGKVIVAETLDMLKEKVQHCKLEQIKSR